MATKASKTKEELKKELIAKNGSIKINGKDIPLNADKKKPNLTYLEGEERKIVKELIRINEENKIKGLTASIEQSLAELFK